MDVIALAQAGIVHAVAPLGTAITPEQLQLCWQLVDEPALKQARLRLADATRQVIANGLALLGVSAPERM